MSRVNKYRAWCKHWWVENSQDKTEYFMEYNIETIILENTPNFPQGRFIGKRGLWCAIHESILMQYIGVDDKNGKEIYEGDIVRQFADCTELGNDLYFFYVIEWDEEYCAFVGREICSNETYLMPDLKDIEVIGNVYENADLLKEVEISE